MGKSKCTCVKVSGSRVPESECVYVSKDVNESVCVSVTVMICV